MTQKFEDLAWHDSELIEILIDRGVKDNVQVIIKWSEDDNDYLGIIEFINCYAFKSNMHFGIVPPDSILDAECISRSEDLDTIRKVWCKMGVDLSALSCYRIITNSTNSLIEIFALGFTTIVKKL
jgi:hypothetical protein